MVSDVIATCEIRKGWKLDIKKLTILIKVVECRGHKEFNLIITYLD